MTYVPNIPMTGDGVALTSGMEVWVWDYDAWGPGGDAVCEELGEIGPKISKYASPTAGYTGVRNKSCYSTREACVAAHNAENDEWEARARRSRRRWQWKCFSLLFLPIVSLSIFDWMCLLFDQLAH